MVLTSSRVAESLSRARGKIFLGASIQNFAGKKTFSDNETPRRQLFSEHFSGRVRCNWFPDFTRIFPYFIWLLCLKNRNISPEKQKSSDQKMTGAPQKIYRGSHSLRARGNLSPLPPPPPLGGPVFIILS
jgi:hypothetical protein